MTPLRKLLLALSAAALLACLAAGPASAAFGIKSFKVTALNKSGEIEERAGAHPYEFNVELAMNTHLDEEDNEVPDGRLKVITVDLPPGLVGDPLATPRCTRAQFEGVIPHCPSNTQVGFARVQLAGLGEGVEARSPVYNLVPPFGTPVTLGLAIDNILSLQEASVRTGGDYGASVSDFTVPTGIGIKSVKESIWGFPADQSHNPERWCQGQQDTSCPSEGPLLPFLSLPTSCTGPLTTTVHVESLEQPGVVVSKSTQSVNGEGQPAGMRECESPPFSPSFSMKAETSAASSPTGLHVNFHIPQNQDPNGLATADLRDTDLTLPAGLAINASAANGLTACAPSQIALNAPGPGSCPDSSKVGVVTVKTPLIDHPLAGDVYLATQGANPFGSLLALYIVLDDPITGVVVKQAVKLEPDLVSGAITATTHEIPQLPFEDLEFEFFGGPRAPLTTPPTCGSFTTAATLTPWTSPEAPAAFRTDAFAISSGANGAPCPASEAAMPNAPGFEAGTTTPLGGVYSPFVVKLSRENGSQRLRSLNFTLPKGLTGRLAGLAECSEAQIAAAQARRNPGEGALERANPSCPATSEIGVVNVGAGSGSPLYVQGRAYLAGPYKGAPLSTVIITPAVAGPIDLGVVVVRAALYVNERTAQITIKSDPIPTMLQGIPLDVRSVAVTINRPDFTLNPTNCDPTALTGEALAPTGSVAPLYSRFQVGGCGGLGFAPKLALSLKGATRRSGHPALKAVVTYPSGGSYANIASAQVGLPHSEFLDQGNLDKVCTQPQLRSQTCPKKSVYGHAKAWTPLLDKPLEGPVYIGVGFGHKLPDLVADLNGKVRILLNGRVDTTKHEGLRNTFEAVPDAPVSRFVLEMKGGKKYGLLENSENLCSKPQNASALFVAQNGKSVQLQPKIANDCGKKKTKKKKKRN